MTHPRLTALFSVFNREGLRWCLLRLPSGPYLTDGDVDLLLDRDQVAQARKVLASQDFICLPGWKPGLHFLTYDFPTDRWIWLHFVTELAFGPEGIFKTGAENLCLDRRKCAEPEFCLAEEDAFWELFLHCLVDKGQIAARHRSRLNEIARSCSPAGPLSRVVEKILPPGWSFARVAHLAREEGWPELEGLAPALKKNWRRSIGFRIVKILWWKTSAVLARMQNWPDSRGLSVALLGPDGAGKTTLLTGLQQTFMLPVYPAYMGLTGGWLLRVNRLRLPFLVIPGHLAIFWFRYLRALFSQLRGRLVIFDRYTYDYCAPTPYPMGRWERIYRWIDGHSCPGPDLVLVLDAPGEVMFQRKGEYTPEMLEDWRRHFLAFASRLRQSQLVDTNRPAETVRAEVTNRIWQGYARRWGKKCA